MTLWKAVNLTTAMHSFEAVVPLLPEYPPKYCEAMDMLSRFSLLQLICLSLLIISSPSCIEDHTRLHEVRSKITSLQQEYAPDSRVARFAVKAKQQADTIVLEGETNLPQAHDELLTWMDENAPVFRNNILMMPAGHLQGRHWGVVNVSVANIRSQPKHSGELATQALLGTGLRVLKQEGEWYLVQTPDQYLGWLEKGALALFDDAAYQRWLATDKVIYLPDYGFSWSGTGPEGGRVSDLVSGNILASEGALAGYRAVVYPDGRRAFIPDDEVQAVTKWLAQTRAGIPDLIGTAYRMIGRPYLWGGTSGKGMDCSGFTKMVYYLNGLVIPRDASQQVHAGIEIPLDTSLQNLQAGDFLFFGQSATDQQAERIRHVGIYLGEGQFIHSGADNPGVLVQSLRPQDANYAPHRRSTWLRSRRLEPGSPGVIPIRELNAFYGINDPQDRQPTDKLGR